MPTPPRNKVMCSFIILVVIMIFTNLILLALYTGDALEKKARENPRSTEVSSIRFVYHSDGRLYLFTPEPINNSQISRLAGKIEELLNRKNLLHSNVQGVLRLENRLRRSLEFKGQPMELTDVWRSLKGYPVTPLPLPLGPILQSIHNAPISQVTNGNKGTQLKLELMLEGGQLGFFKPKWYTNDIVIDGDIFGGKDRHFGEIASFYLSMLLGYDAPIVVGKKLDLQKAISVGSKQFTETVWMDGDKTCFYGSCFYCSRNDSVCADGNVIDGALVILINHKIRLVPSPWRRTYKTGTYAQWETSMDYCSNMKSSDPKQREFLLDIVAVSIFDFLIGNGDRHHFEMFAKRGLTQPGHSKTILLIDNGKSFGNSNEDYIDILAPLLQCCKIRSKLWRTLEKFSSRLGKSLESVTQFDPLYPLLTQEHLAALDRRLNVVFAGVQICEEEFGQNVIVP